MLNTLRKIRLPAFRLEEHWPFGHQIFLKIAEPRAIRIMQFTVYIFMVWAGLGIFHDPPSKFVEIIGYGWVSCFASFITVGAVLGAIAVLPGVWWLERTGIIALSTGLGIYVIIVFTLGSSPIGLAVSLAFIMTFVQRFTEIKGAQLAPKEPREA